MTKSVYKSWRDELLLEVSERLCKPCTDPRKQKHTINYDAPLQCGCRCERVHIILAHAEMIDEDIERGGK